MWVLGFVLQTFSYLTKRLKVGICQCCSSCTSGVGLFLIHEIDEILGFLLRLYFQITPNPLKSWKIVMAVFQAWYVCRRVEFNL